MAKVIRLVDDDAQFVAIVSPPLLARGYEVRHAKSGREAEVMLRSGRCPPRLLVIDGLLPDTTGFALIERLKQTGSTIPIVFVSAFWRDANSFQHLQRLGVARVIHKPVNPVLFAQ